MAGGVKPRAGDDNNASSSDSTIANPRLIDVFGAEFTQEDVGFAVPKLHEDIPLYVDPFLLWVSGDPEYQSLHARVLDFFRLVSGHVRNGDAVSAAQLLAGCHEPQAMGLGYTASSRRGNNIGPGLIASILAAHEAIPQLLDGGIRHLEEMQLVVPKFAEDRLSDTASSIVKDFFIDYTHRQCKAHGIPTRKVRLGNIYSPKHKMWVPAPEAQLPFNPVDDTPILLVPLDLLRHLPWINYEHYYRSSFSTRVLPPSKRDARVAKEAVLQFNARNYVEVERYVTERERLGAQCKPDPLFQPLSLSVLKSRLKKLLALPSGSADGADREYEDLVHDILCSLLYPTLEFAESRVRTASGAHIRDLIFYNDAKTDFWRDLRDRYEARQPVFELKNVRTLETEHVNQLYRYLDKEFGRLGILVTRNPTPKSVQRNAVDLHSSKRVTVLCLDDRDLELMLAMADSGRSPADVLKKKFIEFTRLLPK
ncbi:MAG: hypothetical protein CVT59_08350 [Actinobacteria bacterium HGW-Actinobacteria-1]|jgi:hypothetical protein|nr:MAG: hypothetical protein CVT59_08350 [Actinobacteria bacterium HGW-Actinobacteria-1]